MSIVTTQCWETCFQQLANDGNREILREIHETGDTIKRIKDINMARGIVFLLDNTIGTLCPESSSSSSSSRSSSSSSSSSSESFEQLTATEAANIWTMQLQLMTIFATMSGSSYSFPVQFNEYGAWACDEYTCLDCCQMFELTTGSYLTPVQTNQTACLDNLVEPACRMGYHTTVHAGCPSTVTDPPNSNMTVAIFNSDIHSHLKKRSQYALDSPCENLFDLRYAVGLHHAKWSDLKRFASDDDYYNMLSDSIAAQTVVSSLYSCMKTDCCSTAGTVTTGTTCEIYYGHTGEFSSTLSTNPPNGP